MSDYTPITSVNSELISAGLNPSNPQSTYVDFANSMTKNRQEQDAQEQAIARATELAKQAKHQTTEEQGAEDAGVNSLTKDMMTPDEASKYLKIVLKEKGLPADDDLIDSWVASLDGKLVPREEVEVFASRLGKEAAHVGSSASLTTEDRLKVPVGKSAADMGLENAKDAMGNKVSDTAKSDGTFVAHVPEDGQYQVLYDNQGVKGYVAGGKTPVDPSVKANQKAADTAEKSWKDLDKVVDGAFKTRSGGLGSLSTAIFRAVRGINTITAHDNLTAQDLANISQDVSGIFQGGAPTVVGAKDNDYSVTLANLANTFRKYTGILPKVEGMLGHHSDPLHDTKMKLLQVLVDLRDSAIQNLKGFIESEIPAYKPIIDADPARWQDFEDKKLKFIESGALLPVFTAANPAYGASPLQLNITGMDQAVAPKDPNAAPAVKTTTPPATRPPLDSFKK